MPFILTVPMTTAELWSPNLDDQRGMHAIFFRSLSAINPTLAQQVHDSPTKPFTQSLQLIRPKRSSPTQESQLVWQITLLQDALYEPLLEGLYQYQPTTVQNKAIQLDLSQMVTDQQSYDNLRQEPITYRHSFRFVSPTSFKKSYYSSPLPTPYDCWQSWLRRWQFFAPKRLVPINTAVLDIVSSHIVVSKFNMQSAVMRNADWHIIGGVGSFALNTIKRDKLDKQWWQDIAVLAAFSPFCGTGHKTTFGLGLTRRDIENTGTQKLDTIILSSN